MDKYELGIEIHNKEELIRIYEMNKGNTEDKTEISEWDKRITKANTDMAALKEQLDKLG